MDWTSWILLLLQVILGIMLFVAIGYVKGLPDAIHKRQEQQFQQQLDRELELLRIAQSDIQIRKTEEFLKFSKMQRRILVDKDFQEKIKQGDLAAKQELQELALELGTGLFFFASDESVRLYTKWKSDTAKGSQDPYAVLNGLGSLMVALRRDVGYADTTMTGDDFIKTFVIDWEAIVPKQK